LAARIEVQAHAVADLDRRLEQIDRAVEETTRRGRTNAALAAIGGASGEGQRKARAGLVDERKKEAGALAALKAERAGVAARGVRLRLRPHRSGTWPNSLARATTMSGRLGG